MLSNGEVFLYSDGGSRGNPGDSAIGIAIFDASSKLIHKHSSLLGLSTNNKAEYAGLIKGLQISRSYTLGKVYCFSDSELVIRQINGEYRVRNHELKKLHKQVIKESKSFKSTTFQHLPRTDSRIKIADSLVNLALDSNSDSDESFVSLSS